MLRSPFVAVIASIVCSACYHSKVYNPTTVPQTQAAAPRIILGDLQRDRDIITEEHEPFFAGIRRAMNSEFPRTGIASVVLPEREARTVDGGSRTFLVRYRATDFSAITNPNGGMLAMVAACSLLLIPCAFVGLPPTARETVQTTWEVRVYDVTGQTPNEVRDQDSNELVPVWDTAHTSPLLRRTYEITARAGLGRMKPAEQLRFSREFAAEVARALIAESLDDISTAIRNAPPTSPTSPSPAAPSVTGAGAVPASTQ